MYLKIYLKPTFMDLAPDCLCPVEVAASYFRVGENCLHGAPKSTLEVRNKPLDRRRHGQTVNDTAQNLSRTSRMYDM